MVSDVLRDAQRFGFDSLEALAACGEALVTVAAKAAAAYPEAARDVS